MLKFYREKNNETKGDYKGINKDNFMKEFKNFFEKPENNNEDKFGDKSKNLYLKI